MVSNAHKICLLAEQAKPYASNQTKIVNAPRLPECDTMRNRLQLAGVSLIAVSARATDAQACTPQCKERTRRRITPLHCEGRSGG